MLLEVEAHGVEHLALNHWLGTKAYAFPSVLVNQKLALPGDLQTSMRFCSESVESVMIEIAVVPHLLNPAPTTAAAVSSLVVRASVHAYSHFAKSGMGLTLSVPHQTHAALQLLSQLWHPFWSLPDPHQPLAAVDRPQLLDVYHSAHPGLQGLLILSVQCSAMLTNLPGDLRFGTSHVPTMVLSTAVVLQPLPAWSDIVADDSYEEGMCLIQEKLFTNETVGLLPYGSEATPSGESFTLHHLGLLHSRFLMIPAYCHALLELTLGTIDMLGYACLLLARRRHAPALVISLCMCKVLISILCTC